MLDADRQPAPDILDALPIFPLPNVVFLPGMVLPLHVFEPRYLELVDAVLAGGRHIGVPLLLGTGEGDAIEGVFGVGKLIAHQRLADGRRFIRLEGLGRVRAVDELPSAGRSFRRVMVEALPERPVRDLHALEILKAQIERLAATFDGDERDMVHTVLGLDDPRVVIYAIASLVPNVELLRAARLGWPTGSVPHMRLLQRCLAAEDADARVELLSRRAQLLLDALAKSDALPFSGLN